MIWNAGRGRRLDGPWPAAPSPISAHRSGMRRASFRLRCRSLLAALVLMVLLPRPTQAANGQALVIGESNYADAAALPACRQAADLVSARLRRLGFAVDELVDASVGDTRVAINRFAGDVASAPGQASLAYVCAAATTEEQRLFLLPSDAGMQRPLEPETQGIVVPALLNAMRGSDGTLVGEFVMQAGAAERQALDGLRARLPPGLHLALTISDAPHAGSVGRVLASHATPLPTDWYGLAGELQARADKMTVTLYAPTPAPPAGATAASVTTATSLPPATSVPTTKPTPIVNPPGPASTASPRAAAAVQPANPATPAPHLKLLAPLPVIAIPPAPVQTAVAAARLPAPSPVKSQQVSPSMRWSNPRYKRLQSALHDQGLYSGPLDGIMSARTIMAIRAFQISIGKPSSGTLTSAEVIALLNSH